MITEAKAPPTLLEQWADIEKLRLDRIAELEQDREKRKTDHAAAIKAIDVELEKLHLYSPRAPRKRKEKPAK